MDGSPWSQDSDWCNGYRGDKSSALDDTAEVINKKGLSVVMFTDHACLGRTSGGQLPPNSKLVTTSARVGPFTRMASLGSVVTGPTMRVWVSGCGLNSERSSHAVRNTKGSYPHQSSPMYEKRPAHQHLWASVMTGGLFGWPVPTSSSPSSPPRARSAPWFPGADFRCRHRARRARVRDPGISASCPNAA